MFVQSMSRYLTSYEHMLYFYKVWKRETFNKGANLELTCKSLIVSKLKSILFSSMSTQVRLFNTLPLKTSCYENSRVTVAFCNCPRPFCYDTKKAEVDLLISEDLV